MREFLTTDEVGERLGVSRQHVARLVKAGRLPYVRSGRLIKFPVKAWEQYMATQTEAALAGMGEGGHVAEAAA